MRLAGYAQVNPGDLRFLSLLSLGITEEEFVSVAKDAAKGAKSWNWLLATVEGRRRDAAAIANLPAQPTRPQNARDRAAATAGALISMPGAPARPAPQAFDFDLDHEGGTHVQAIAR